MNKTIYVSLLLVSQLYSRENPFAPIDLSKIQKVTSNVIENKPPLGNLSYTLPDASRTLQEVTLTVQNLDGSIQTLTIPIDKAIDWHKALVISQGNYAPACIQNKSGFADFGSLSFSTQGNRLTVTTSDTIIQHFSLTEPNTIIIDFKNNKLFNKIEKRLDSAPFVSVSVGNHGKFLRASIILDGHYSYTLSRSGKSITIICK